MCVFYIFFSLLLFSSVMFFFVFIGNYDVTIYIITLKYAYIPIIALSAFQRPPKVQMAIIKKNLLSLCTIYTRQKYWLRAVLATKLISLQTNLQELTRTVSVLTI